MENSKQFAFPAHSKQGLTKEEYAAINISGSMPKLFFDRYVELHPDPPHPGTVAEIFKSTETEDKKPYAGFIQSYFDIGEGEWAKGVPTRELPQEVFDAVNEHVNVVRKYYDDLDEFILNRIVVAEVEWRRRMAKKLMDSFDQAV